MQLSWGQHARRLSEHVTVLSTPDNGAYPSGNTLLVQGAGESVVIDPSVTVVEKGGVGVSVDAVINSHGHEDHIAGNGVFPEARVHIHHDDIEVVRSIEALMALTESTPENHPELQRQYLEEFHYQARPDAEGFADGYVWDLGGVEIEAVLLPGHTAGHCGMRISDGVFFLSDIDLTGFGPYYGDVFSSLEQFETSLVQVRNEEADVYVTFHHKGVIEGQENFVAMLDAFHAVITRRHDAMLDYLAEPHSIDEMVEHRFVYRKHVEMPIVDRVERRTAMLHVERMLDRGEATEVEPGRYRVG